ncbi:MAG: VWA domain-containing protein [Candidatus Koribacter versatilis]|uniref:VWA domain-containing protein n=1 Tax=Candidatus Korobacter versatilis TaxID=658062 RepID=A0A932A935_9BACT|nr:VWA domain-containing protein [Candidatus Koribacter versatilis]
MLPKTLLVQPAKHIASVVLLALWVGAVVPAFGQQQPAPPQQQPGTQTPDPQNKDAQEANPTAGGPGGDVGTIAVPKKKDESSSVEKKDKPEKFKNPAGMPDFSVRVDVPSVNVDVTVLTREGGFVPGLHQENFRVLEDGVPQKVTTFTQTEAPITAVLLVEFANTNYSFVRDMLNASYTFAQGLKPQDWVAVVSYDMKPQIMADFTQDKRQIYAALGHLRIPGFSETNLFDALYDTLDRIDRIEGRKYVILIASGVDTFSKHTLDDAYKKVKTTPNVTIFAISTGGYLRTAYEPRMGPISQLNYLQADNQMNYFAKMTGGQSYRPRFLGEFPEIFNSIANVIRNQYSLTYHPSNTRQDGSYRKIKIELINPQNGAPLKMVNEKGKELKYQIIAREGYNAKHVVE